MRIKQEEVKRMKALKMREMKGKLDMVGQEGGWGAVKGANTSPNFLLLLVFITLLCSFGRSRLGRRLGPGCLRQTDDCHTSGSGSRRRG